MFYKNSFNAIQLPHGLEWSLWLPLKYFMLCILIKFLFQGVFLPSFHQVSNGFFRGSRNTVKAKSSSAAASNFRQTASTTTSTDLPVTTLLDDPLVSEVAKELSKIPKNDLAALLDRTILPRIQVSSRKILIVIWFKIFKMFTANVRNEFRESKVLKVSSHCVSFVV